jgi:serine/threonine protein kinase/Tol biopolymer transport system component
MGVVYRAHDEHLDCDVALKVLPVTLLTDETARKCFRKEALTLAKLKHPNIATIHDFDTDGGVDFLVMEYVDGVTLTQKVAQGALPEKELLTLGSDIARTLNAAHSQGVVHSDLKPGNIMLTSRGHVKLLDFGLAKLVHVSDTAATETLSQTQGATGTLPYMAPEQLQGKPPDYRSDLYSLGAVFYELATGRRPLRAEGVAQLIHAILLEPPVRPRELNSRVSAELERIILKCLEKDPENRYQSAKEISVDLRRLEAPASISGMGAARIPSPRKTRNKALMVGLAGLFVLTGSVLGLFFWRQNSHKMPAVSNSGYVPLTDFNDSAVAPALSPDGRMLAFVRFGNIGDSAARGQVYVKLLPGGEPVQLTGDALQKGSLAFSPDGAQIVYTVVDKAFVWDSWQVPVFGGSARLFMANASGLIWGGDKQLVYSEIKQGVHMGVASSDENRAGHRDIYLPIGEGSMAHRSALSPDHKWLLIAEMDGTAWLPCRILPFDGSSTGRRAGPNEGQCTSAAWSPDGQWMYFSSTASGSFHIWRQKFPDGTPEQITSGATEEEGTAPTPDGKYVITSVGIRHASIWIHDSGGDHQLTSEGFAMLPTPSPSGDKVFYLVSSGSARAYISAELWTVDMKTGEKARALPGYTMSHYRISRDGKQILFTSTGNLTGDGVWIADVDRRSSPRQLTHGSEFRAFFGAPGEILYLSEGKERHLFRMKEDGSNQEMVMPDAITYLISVSPDGQWAAVTMAQTPGTAGSVVKLFPTRRGEPFLACGACMPGSGPGRRQAPMLDWSTDGRYLFVSLQYFGLHSKNTVVLPYRSGLPFGKFWPKGLTSERDFAALAGVRIIPEPNAFPGLELPKYVFWKMTTQSNLYRIPLPE